jgi:hypothetical protein
VSSTSAIVFVAQQFVEPLAYEYDTMKTKITMIAAAVRQRPMNLSSRAVKSRSAMAPPTVELFGTMIQ